MATETKTIKCYKCNVPLEGPAEAKSEDTFRCPVCGEHDTLDNVLAEVKTFATEAAAKHLNKSIERATRGSKFLQVKKKFTEGGVHRFKVDIDFLD